MFGEQERSADDVDVSSAHDDSREGKREDSGRGEAWEDEDGRDPDITVFRLSGMVQVARWMDKITWSGYAQVW